VIVKNVRGTVDNTCKDASWLEHWKRFSGQSLPSYCAQRQCRGKPEVGAHVQKDSSTDKAWYIVPLCARHNVKAIQLELIDDIKLAPANVAETCGKK